ncbi:hypothetical protein [Novipirellula artificiosorum]|uniref:Uncharacterized protein n=1 Tax=Novipirellula artificiosorum TaxID=2528016 RepID=A0A5C6DWG3_9BACT|nr:hypothetical protein [Novipirellula artificiosorum]TWU39396.1 hypothetical protein Poly41_22200 [Novipirellula artificiosorum]
MTHIQAKFQTTTAARGRHRVTSVTATKPPPTPRVPHVTKLMALAIRLDHLLATGQFKDQAEIARTAGITRARVTQILNLNNLAPDIQERIIGYAPSKSGQDSLKERQLRNIANQSNWNVQRQRLGKALDDRRRG